MNYLKVNVANGNPYPSLKYINLEINLNKDIYYIDDPDKLSNKQYIVGEVPLIRIGK